MCGIAGWLGRLPEGEQVAKRTMELLHHRGPDGGDLRQWPEATLVHTRLSIIDLSRLVRSQCRMKTEPCGPYLMVSYTTITN